MVDEDISEWKNESIHIECMIPLEYIMCIHTYVITLVNYIGKCQQFYGL